MTVPTIRGLATAFALVLTLTAAGCRSTAEPGVPLTLDARAAAVAEIPVLGTDSTLDVGTWNLEWFGDAGHGPEDETLQRANIVRVLSALEVDLWSLQEVTGGDQFDDLVADLPGYAGFLANDPVVTDGPAYYNDFGGNEQKVGLLYREDVVTVESARVILTDHDWAFAGRPPVQARVTVHPEGGRGEPLALVVILLHAKAGADPEDRDRRAMGAEALQRYLDTTFPSAPVLVIGDFNDDVDTSIARGHPSPYGGFVDAADFAFPTAALSAAGATSTVFYSDMIDHQLATDDLLAHFIPGATAVFPADQYLDDYGDTTSDHYPVLARYAPWTAGGPDMVTGAVRAAVELVWSGADSGRVDLFRNGQRLVTTENDGAHTDTVRVTAGGAVGYRVCEADTHRCSPEARVAF